MPLKLGSTTLSKLFTGATEITKAYLGQIEVYSSAPAFWTPASLGSSLAIWLDASDESTITLNGSTVSQWADKSGNGRNVSQAVASNQPAYQATGFVGKPGIYFSGSARYLFNTSAFMHAAGSISAFAAMRPAPSAINQFFLAEGSSAVNTPIYAPIVNKSTTDLNDQSVYYRTDLSGGTSGTTLFDDGMAQADRIVGLTDSGTRFIGYNNGATGSSVHYTRGVTTLNQFSIGGLLRTTFGLGMPSTAGEIVVATGVLSTADRQKLEGYLAWKWGGATRPWTPADLDSSLALWLDAADASTITLNGSTVSQWSDKSGNGRNASQPIAANQPTYTPSGLNGKPIITFPGGGDGFVLASGVPLPRDMTSVSQGFGYLYSANTATERLAYASPGTNLYWNTATNSPSNLLINGRDGTSTFIEQYTAQNNAWEVLLNGAVAASGSVATAWSNNNEMTQIGLQWGATTGVPSWTGTIAEIVWTSAVMSLADRQRLEGYLAHKWGLAANLPASHPFKNAAPEVTL